MVFQNLALSLLVIVFLVVTSILGVADIGLAIVANSLRLLAYCEFNQII